jgi:uncharacterized paraquat-inducible protein A
VNNRVLLPSNRRVADAQRRPVCGMRSRMVKAECPRCGYIIRTTRKWMYAVGMPMCPCGGVFVRAE